MGRTWIDPSLKVPRYLAGQLDPAEARALEDTYEQDPEVLADLERTLRLKEGLAVLRERGELADLLKVQPRRQWLLRAAVATLIPILLGILFWQRPWLLGRPVPVLSVREPAMHVLRSVVLVRTRGSSSEVDVPLQPRGVAAFRILPSQFVPGERYAVRLSHLSGPSGGRTSSIDTVEAAPRKSGDLEVYVDLTRLSAGDYELSVTPALDPAESDRFVLHLK